MNLGPTTRATTATGEAPRLDPVLPLMPASLPEMGPPDLPELPSAGASTGRTPAVLDAGDPDKFAEPPSADG